MASRGRGITCMPYELQHAMNLTASTMDYDMITCACDPACINAIGPTFFKTKSGPGGGLVFSFRKFSHKSNSEDIHLIFFYLYK